MARKKKKLISIEEKYEIVFESQGRYIGGFISLLFSILFLGISSIFLWFGISEKVDFLALCFSLVLLAFGVYFFYVAMYCFFSKKSFPACILKNDELHINEYGISFGRGYNKIVNEQTISIHNIENIHLKKVFFEKILVLKFDLKKDNDSYQLSEILRALNQELTKKDKIRFKNEIEHRKENCKFRI
ncbi:hypothetical protein [Tenacibaculum jejuense]|uniref:Uncharacterized protein n=1 Tax=Tenacibaculum jejuense TaxID=584609 RepID=A0A238U892_9FLAO|nr:hypothetical protein [Tenacibaculum jejuense]SNR14714.1 protein of unknown function [Tenacibaculum jejuense]